MNIAYQGKLTRNELLQAQKLAALPGRTATLMRIGAAGVVGVIAVIYIIQNPGLKLIEYFGYSLPLIVVCVGLAWPYLTTHQKVQDYLKNLDVQGEMSGLITEQSITLKVTRATSELNWALISGVKIGKGIVLLYQNPNSFFILSSSFFSEADWQQFLAFLRIAFKPSEFVK